MRIPTRRNSLRYPGYDYTSPGGVFVTIVTHNRQEMFGSIHGEDVALTPVGRRLDARWRGIPARFPGVDIDTYVIMPDHIHGIIWIGTGDTEVMPSTGDIVRWVKTAVLSDVTAGVRNAGWAPYDGRLWQRGFHDHIIRGNQDLHAVRQYIDANPARWWENHS